MKIKYFSIGLVNINLLFLSSCGVMQKELDKSLGKKPKNPASHSDTQSPGIDSEYDANFNLQSSLKSFKDCSETEKWLEDKVIATIEKATNQQILMMRCQVPEFSQKNQDQCQKFGAGVLVGSVASSDNRSIETANTSSVESGAPTSSKSNIPASTAGNGSSPASSTGTNNQVGGVEEADLVKTQGAMIYYISGKKLQIIQGWPAAEAKMLGSIAIEGNPVEMFVGDQNLVYVISSNSAYAQKPIFQLPIASVAVGAPTARSDPFDSSASTDSVDPQVFRLQSTQPSLQNTQEPRVIMTVVNVADPKAPQIRSTRSFRGSYHSSRKIGNDLRVVVGDHLSSLILPSVSFPQFDDNIDEQEALLKDILEVTTKRIRSKDINFWLKTNDPRGIGPQLGTCEKVYGPTYDTELGLTRIISFIGPETMTESVLLSEVNGLYASAKSLFLTTARYVYSENRNTTVIHKFSWEKEGQSLYQGSGQVEGSPLNQFSMDEHNGNFRIATTANEPKTFQTYSKVYVLAQGQGILETRGATDEMAKGERIYSVRFHGDRGFVVTFRQIDPLFTLDLKDPAAPKVVGELKIPGFSSYIHMMNDTTLLTIGRGGAGTATNSPKISVFDVSNMAAPKEIKSYLVTNYGWGNSEAESNHKAFTYYDALGVLAIPMNSNRPALQTGNNMSSSSIMVFEVKNNPTIKPLGQIELSMAGAAQQGGYAQRSLFMEDYLYGFSNLGMKVRKMSDLTKDVSSVLFP